MQPLFFCFAESAPRLVGATPGAVDLARAHALAIGFDLRARGERRGAAPLRCVCGSGDPEADEDTIDSRWRRSLFRLKLSLMRTRLHFRGTFFWPGGELDPKLCTCNVVPELRCLQDM